VRRSDPDLDVVQALADRIVPRTVHPTVERVAEGVSTHVYRLRRGAETFYLRVLPEAGASFAPEVRAHTLLLARGVAVPEVIYFEPCNPALQRSVMVTTAIPGGPVGRRAVGRDTREILAAAGRDLAVINSLAVEGFGWIRRDHDESLRLEAKHPTCRAFVHEHLEQDLALLRERVLTASEVALVRAILADFDPWLDAEHAVLAHGDFDATHIYQRDGRYSGIIDFGELKGGDLWYDLGHFRMHEGETLPTLALPWLLEGYGAVCPLPADHARRIGFASLLIAIRALAHRLGRYRYQQALVAIRRDISLLRA
jgi:aminoglycoside phosphotransferase (APT) family kinase protein